MLFCTDVTSLTRYVRDDNYVTAMGASSQLDYSDKAQILVIYDSEEGIYHSENRQIQYYIAPFKLCICDYHEISDLTEYIEDNNISYIYLYTENSQSIDDYLKVNYDKMQYYKCN